MKKLLCFINIFVVLFCVSCVQNTNPNKINNVEILKDEIEIDELDIYTGDEFHLNALINDDHEADLKWESSNPDVISVTNTGLVTARKEGTVIITVTAEDYPYVTDSIYITATAPLEQLGVGSGKTKDDAIFLGNEGEDEPIEIYFIEMQHIYADSIFIKKGNVEILIDSGYEYDGAFVNKVLTQYCTDDRLDLLMLSHSDGDHINGLKTALSTIDDVSMMIDYGGVGSGNTLLARNTYKPKGMIYHSAYDCVNQQNDATDLYYLTEDFYFEILDTGSYIKNTDSSAGNAASLAVIFYYKDFSFFTAGDITTSTESKLLKNENLPEVTLYKASHHGSHGSNSQELLDTLNPKAVAISAARANQYNATPGGPNKNNTYNLNGASGHPAAEAIARIYKAPNISKNLNVYWNAVNGTMKFTSYGEDDFVFTGSATLKGYYDLSITNGTPVWNETLNDFENKVTGEENYKLHQTKVFKFRNYIQYLPEWAQKEYFSDNK